MDHHFTTTMSSRESWTRIQNMRDFGSKNVCGRKKGLGVASCSASDSQLNVWQAWRVGVSYFEAGVSFLSIV